MALFRRKYTAQGAPPGVFGSSVRTLEPRLALISFDEESVEERPLEGPSDVPDIRVGKRVSWLDVRGLGDGTVVQELGERLGLHPLAVSDVVNVGQRPKVDEYEDFLFIVLPMVILGADGRLHWEQVSLFLGEHYVVTFQETYEDCLEPLRERIRGGRKRIRAGGAEFLACMVIDATVDGYFPILEHYGQLLEEFETQILEEERQDVLSDLYTAKRDLAGFRRAVWPLREALTIMMRTEETVLSPPVLLHLRDVLDHTMQVIEVNESYRELAASLVDMHLSMVGQRTNEVMRVLTVVSAIFIPLTFVAGVYGMNFDTSSAANLPELRWPYGYVFFWSICLAIGLGLLLLFRNLGWLRRAEK